MPADKAEVICAIEDEEDVLRLIRHCCEEAGYCFACETDGAQGLQLVKDLKPDLLLLDLMLPGKHGLEICSALRQEQDMRQMPIIILSACGDEADVARGLEAGACDYIVKPFRRAEFLARIRRQLRNHKYYLAWRERYERLERLQREQSAQLQQACRLAEIGAMAAGLQHELANIAAGLTMGLDVMQRVSPEMAALKSAGKLSAETRQALATFEMATAAMREDVSRLGDLSHTALNFSRPDFTATASSVPRRCEPGGQARAAPGASKEPQFDRLRNQCYPRSLRPYVADGAGANNRHPRQQCGGCRIRALPSPPRPCRQNYDLGAKRGAPAYP
ncbi:MAG: response regulator, partial [Planctomycetota bacterium]|nr:response regulator [Planctomycetota bacterium]